MKQQTQTAAAESGMTAKKTQHQKIVAMVQIALFAAIIAVCSWIQIPMTVPFTMQTFAVFCALATLGGKGGTISILIYIVLGAVGVPVFAGFTGGIGILCGLLLDISCGTLAGYHGILLFLICLAVSCMYDRLLLQRFWNLIWLTAVAAFVVTGFDFVFQYAIWGYHQVSQLYLHHTLPCLAYTVISSMICYPVFSLIHRFLLPKRRRTIEKKLKPMEETA